MKSIFCFALLLVGCGSLSVNNRMPVVQDPLVPGLTTSYFGIGMAPSQEIEMVKDASEVPPNLRQELGRVMAPANLSLGLGIEKWISLAWDANLSPGGSGIQLKVQLLGPRVYDEITEGDWALGISGTTFSHGISKKGTSLTSWAGSASVQSKGVGFSIGYFPKKETLIYFGASHIDASLAYEVEQAASSSGPAFYASDKSAKGWSHAVGGGARFFYDEASLNVSLQYVTSSYLNFGVTNSVTGSVAWEMALDRSLVGQGPKARMQERKARLQN